MHDIAIIKEGFDDLVELSNSLKDKVEVAKTWPKVSEEIRKAGEARETKLKKELQTSQNFTWKQEA